MTIEEIRAGESKNVEFKASLPEKSIKYMKTVVAFANGTGGRLIFGVEDGTGAVVGVDDDQVFSLMDAVANAISDSCEPAIIPDVALRTVNGKTLIVVEVEAGRQRPYYIKSLGRERGVYVRVAGTSRLADEAMVPTNAYAILTGDEALPTGIQCGVFKGTTRAVFVDRREFGGRIQDQIEQAYQFVLRNIHLGAEFHGLYRQDVYEIPTHAIRELIINAAVHRSYLDHSMIQVAVYDDRLEVTSPGKLPMGQTVERMKDGYSKIRNEALAHAFSYMNLIEHWGSGIPRIIEEVKEAGLREPEFIGGDTDVRINIYRGQIDTNHDTIDTNHDTNLILDKDLKVLLLKLIDQTPDAPQRFYAQKLGVSMSTIKRIFMKMQNEGTIQREGNNRKGKWIIIK